MSTAIMADRGLQISGRMLVDAALPLRDEYLETLDVHGQGQLAVAEWQAARALSSWQKSCQSMAATASSWKTLKRFGLRTSEGIPDWGWTCGKTSGFAFSRRPMTPKAEQT